MCRLLEALQFLTIFRFKKETIIDSKKLGSSIIYFPLIGAFLGLILIILNKLLYTIFPEPLLSLILITTLITLSGALHLDGLADTCDAIFSGKNKQAMLSMMHDTHKGTFGVIGIIIIILFKVSLVSLVPINLRNLGIFLMAILSRYSMQLAITFFPYARREGKAKVFFENKSLQSFGLSTLITLLLLGMTLRWISIVILFLVIIFTLIIGETLKRKIGGLTGDTLGALCELNELVVLLSIKCF